MNFLKYSQRMSVLILSLLFLLGSTTVLGSNDNFVSIDELTAELNTRNIDRILKALNTVKRMSYQGKILPFVHDLWDEREDKYPDLPWKTVNADIVKVEIANILLQAEANGRIEIHREELHKFVSRLINSADVDVARSAILTLTLTDDERDVDKIFSIAKQQKKGTFRASVLTLAKMCNSVASKALDQLEKDVEKSELKSFIAETRASMEAFKERTRWCDY